jgi:hypothetical protein
VASGKNIQIGEPEGNLKELYAASLKLLYQHMPLGSKNNNGKMSALKCYNVK